MKESRGLAVWYAVLLGILILSGAVAVVILLRPFYYAHIGWLDLPGRTGISAAHIKEGYNEMLDYCIGRSGAFSAGIFPFSESGAQHFKDVRVLFQLDLVLALVSPLALAVTGLIARLRRVRAYRFRDLGPRFWSAASVLTVFVVIGGLASLDFDRAFTVFHQLFFPGKDNWLFDCAADPIIDVLPQVFFQNCAILILTIVLAVCLCFLVLEVRRRARDRVQTKTV